MLNRGDLTNRFSGPASPAAERWRSARIIAMKETPYSRFDANNLILRDGLAIDRTVLANERTLMAYLRSGVALLIAGVSIMHFSSEGWFWMVGLACIPTGMITAVIGVARYRRMNRKIALVRDRSKTETRQTNGNAEPSGGSGTPPRSPGGREG